MEWSIAINKRWGEIALPLSVEWGSSLSCLGIQHIWTSSFRVKLFMFQVTVRWTEKENR